MDIKPKFGFHTCYCLLIMFANMACYYILLQKTTSSNSLMMIWSWMDEHCFLHCSCPQPGVHLLSWAMLSFPGTIQREMAGMNSSTMTKFPHPGSTVATCTMSSGVSAPALLYLETVCPDRARQQSQQLHTTVLSWIKNEPLSWNAQECLHPKGCKETAIMQGKRE